MRHGLCLSVWVFIEKSAKPSSRQLFDSFSNSFTFQMRTRWNWCEFVEFNVNEAKKKRETMTEKKTPQSNSVITSMCMFIEMRLSQIVQKAHWMANRSRNQTFWRIFYFYFKPFHVCYLLSLLLLFFECFCDLIRDLDSSTYSYFSISAHKHQ